MSAFAKEQERFREQVKSTLGQSPIEMMNVPTSLKELEEQTRRNVELFQNAMRMFTPFPGATPAARPAEPEKKADKAEKPARAEDISDLKEQIAAMQRKLDSLG